MFSTNYTTFKNLLFLLRLLEVNLTIDRFSVRKVAFGSRNPIITKSR